jgi:hypothetical protein
MLGNVCSVSLRRVSRYAGTDVSPLEFNTHRIIDINHSSRRLRGKDVGDLEGKSVSLHRAFRYERIDVSCYINSIQCVVVLR